MVIGSPTYLMWVIYHDATASLCRLFYLVAVI